MRHLSPTRHLFLTLAVTAAAVAAAFAIPSAADAMTISIYGGDDAKVVGSGHLVDVARKVGNFTTLRIDGPVDVDAHPGSNPGVTIHADDNVEPLIETVVEGDALVVRLKKGASFRTGHDMKVEVEFGTLAATAQHGSGDLHITTLTAPKLESSIAGSGDLKIDNLQLGSFTMSVAGSGDVRVAGHADNAKYSVAGSGDIDAARLAARRVDISISGSGDAHVNASDAVDARVAGSGDITISGHPHDVSRRVSGSGSIETVN
jgi:hypothetical protein